MIFPLFSSTELFFSFSRACDISLWIFISGLMFFIMSIIVLVSTNTQVFQTIITIIISFRHLGTGFTILNSRVQLALDDEVGPSACQRGCAANVSSIRDGQFQSYWKLQIGFVLIWTTVGRYTTILYST